jgi:hypothetical protein
MDNDGTAESPLGRNGHWPNPTIVAGIIGFIAVICSGLLAQQGIRESANLQARSSQEERLWNGRTKAYGDVVALAKKRQVVVARLATLEATPDVPGGRTERLAILTDIRNSQADLDAALTQSQLLSGRNVHDALGDLAKALTAVATSSEGIGAAVGCSELFPAVELFTFCGRYVDRSAPIDEQALASRFVEKGEIQDLTGRLDDFVKAASQELSGGA